MSKLPFSTLHKTKHFMTRTIWGFIVLGVIAFVIGVTIAFLVGRSIKPPAYQNGTIGIENTLTPYRIQTPTSLPETEVPIPTQTPEPTERPTGATETVREGDSYWLIVKRVCRSLGYKLSDYEPTAAMLVEMNQKHNKQYVGNTLQPGEKVGIGCILYE
jgi:hypothetical protein